MSMLAEPNDESPANVDAAKMWRDNKAEYERVVRSQTARLLGIASSARVNGLSR